MSSNKGSKYDGTALSNCLHMLNDTYQDPSPCLSYYPLNYSPPKGHCFHPDSYLVTPLDTPFPLVPNPIHGGLQSVYIHSPSDPTLLSLILHLQAICLWMRGQSMMVSPSPTISACSTTHTMIPLLACLTSHPIIPHQKGITFIQILTWSPLLTPLSCSYLTLSNHWYPIHLWHGPG